MSKNPAEKIEQWAIERLVPYARNARTHSSDQVAQIAASIKEWGWTTPILVDETGNIIAGHGRTMAARQLNIKEVPVMVAEGWSDIKKRAYILADNKLALNAGWDNEMLALELSEPDRSREERSRGQAHGTRPQVLRRHHQTLAGFHRQNRSSRRNRKTFRGGYKWQRNKKLLKKNPL